MAGGDRRGVRHGMLGGVALVLLGILGTRLWFLQVVDADEIKERVEAVRERVVILPPERGRIFDVDGRILADNSRVLTITVDQEVIRRKNDRAVLFERLAGPLGTTFDDLEEKYQNNPDAAQLPFAAARDVSEETALYLKERVEDYPGVDVREDWDRVYLYSPIASHILGYMGAVPADDPATPEDELQVYLDAGYLRNEKVGSSGIERFYESDLRGSSGRAVYEVDAIGRVLRTVEYVPPVPGRDVQLTIDLELQQFAEQALETQLRLRRTATPYSDKEDLRHYTTFYKAPAGSVVVEEHGTGRIVAMATYPTFDNRWFNAGISSEKFAQIFPPENKDIPFDERPPSPLINRAIQGRYNVGSTFKPFVAYAAVDRVLETTGLPFIPSPLTDVYVDQGTYDIPDDQCNRADGVRCTFKNAWNFALGAPTYYGEVTLSDALAVSSDTFFYRIGAEMFINSGFQPVLQEELKKFGFGEKSGIDLPFEYKGIIPDAAIKAKLAEQGAISDDEGRGFYVGDSVQMAIGQGLVAVTPLQLANAYATYANGGFLLQPQMVKAIYEPGVPDAAFAGFADVSRGTLYKDFAPVVKGGLEMDPNKVAPIYDGLRRVLTAEGTPGHLPTGFKMFRGYSIASTLLGKTGTAQGRENLAENDSSVFAAFENRPDGYTIAAYLEKSGYGSQAAAPLTRCLFQAIRGEVIVDDVVQADALDVSSTVAAPSNLLSDFTCLQGDTTTTTAER